MEWSWLTWLIALIIGALIVLWVKGKMFKEKIIIKSQPPKPAKKPGRVKITRRDNGWNRETSVSTFQQILKEREIIPLNIKELWSDTILQEISLTIDFCRALQSYFSDFKEDEHSHTGIDVEIGGFLLGRYTFSQDDNAYRVIVETFVPIDSENDHSLHLEFSTHSLSTKLGDAQDAYPDLVLVGWFHTHPGHGLFLSKPDLAIHRGFFNEGFQFAMEIDSLAPNLDLGFFTQKRNGDMNNHHDGSAWFSWRDIEKQLVP